MPKHQMINNVEQSIDVREEIINLLQSTHRENIEKVIDFLNENGFFEAPASVKFHNNFQGGLAKHSLEVYRVAIELNKTAGLPEASIILCSLLHDVCKSDQYVITNGRPTRVEANITRGHGRRSMFMLIRRCQLPLNYDETMAIWWHMGEHEPSRKQFEAEYKESKNIPLCTLIQTADGKAASQAMQKN